MWNVTEKHGTVEEGENEEGSKNNNNKPIINRGRE